MCKLAQVRFPVGIKNVSFLETMKFQDETFSQCERWERKTWEKRGVKDGRGKHGKKEGCGRKSFRSFH
jgi:hypothetical protein